MAPPDLLNLRSVVRTFGPPWLFNEEGYRFFYAIATVADELQQFALEGQRAKFPELCTPGALPRIGRDRLIPRGFSETDEGYGSRLILWREDWKHAGGAYAIMSQLRAFLTGYDNTIRLVNQQRLSTGESKWRTLEMDDTRSATTNGNWNWDGDFATWARVWPIIYADPILERDGTWGDGEAWGDNPTQSWGSTASPELVDAVRVILGQGPGAVSAEGFAPFVVVSFDNSAFSPTDSAPPMPDGTWGGAYKVVADVAVPARDPRAIYWPGP